jgi:[FeFe] hydrogenase H-cluster maturation GTPase HydF
MKTPESLRLHISVFGRRNAGKSSVVNSLAGHRVSIVSDTPGTTTDPVKKAMELLPLGPVLFTDTAGLDDPGELGAQRVSRTRKVGERTDLAVVVTDEDRWGPLEDGLAKGFQETGIPLIVVRNKIDRSSPGDDFTALMVEKGLAWVAVSALTGEGVDRLREEIIRLAPESFINPSGIVSDLVPPGGTAVLVVPIDKEAPRGRLIMPQVQTIRDLLDNDSMALVVKERELRMALRNLSAKPSLVITDSQAFLKVAGDTPDDVPMTSFSILFARFQGDLPSMVRGAAAIGSLRSGDRVLIAEACTHHPIGEDIGTVKLPRWLNQFAGGRLDFQFHRGAEFPEDLASFRLVIHCGACMFNRRAMLTRIQRASMAGVPITNYGLAIAYSLGIFERALGPFPEALDQYRRSL